MEETIEKVSVAVRILRAFRAAYDDHRGRLAEYFKGKETLEWEFAPQLVFHRYDNFLSRVETVNVSLHRSEASLRDKTLASRGGRSGVCVPWKLGLLL